MNPKLKRLIYILFCGFILTIATLMILKSLNNNILHFYSPSELKNVDVKKNKFRIGGLVEKNSIVINDLETKFTLSDGLEKIDVFYIGVLPDLFREGQGIVAEGKLIENKFVAKSILAKHDENYMPKEIADKLKETGQWQGVYDGN